MIKRIGRVFVSKHVAELLKGSGELLKHSAELVRVQQKTKGLGENLKSSAKCLKSSAACLYYNMAHAVPTSLGIDVIFIVGPYDKPYFVTCCFSYRLKNV